MASSAAKKLGKRIKALRQAKGLTQVQLAEAAGYDPVTISRFERGEYAPGLDALETLGQVLEQPIGAFFQSEIEQDSMSVMRHQICDAAYRTQHPGLLADMLKAINKVRAKYGITE
ncbi:helix-turn-helix domain-containing protein [Pseudomonas aeruginosa]|uniref:helix-turn-helix domain-containing protein n=1 Tax=Pseudomonas aeruginosa TaxID=287 RepID=UPI003CE96A8F